jgi:hypothetical protein
MIIQDYREEIGLSNLILPILLILSSSFPYLTRRNIDCGRERANVGTN